MASPWFNSDQQSASKDRAHAQLRAEGVHRCPECREILGPPPPDDFTPLDIVDGRTPEQLRADGDDHWPDGRPYQPVLDTVELAAGADLDGREGE
jgi:hypothetical protein